MRRSSRSGALIAAYFDTLDPAARSTVQELRQAVMAAAPQFQQVLKWGNLCFQLDGRTLLMISAHKTHASLQFFNGAALAEQFPQLEGPGRSVRLLKWRYSQPVNQALVRELAAAAVQLGLPASSGSEGSC
ncbi:DUF1801 domain-containing protein [Caldimonas tepidiphila]|uniref:DUF1801 domain-containing protein n=1 Tax=Caldimonas tepidiphila TaxID=2315841 RepID=UPI000E5C567E|nr:DUF1801 domain-containing protein [Caldimonas tepidiphila]